MIEFKKLVEAIHASIHSAAKSVEEDGARRINKFFYEVDEEGNEIDSDANEEFVDFNFKRSYRPKTVTMEFPFRGNSNEPDTVEVQVPLIVLSPISTPKVTEAKFTAELEVTTDDKGRLQVGFPDKSKKGLFGGGGEHNGNTKLEIVVKGSESPAGLKKVIEGYERALRAQIPG